LERKAGLASTKNHSKSFINYYHFFHIVRLIFAPMSFNIFKKKDKNAPPVKKGVLREWWDAAIFAIVVATLIRTFIMEAYTIPTPSMEGSLLVNDFLFVSKMHYGARIPMTPLSVPFLHNELPFGLGKSYSESVNWGYKRLPGFSKVERFDDVVFNYPEGDTIIAEYPGASYYDMVRNNPSMAAAGTIDNRPVDKMDNYIKRCVGIPGDKIEVRAGRLFVNDAKATEFTFLQSTYFVRTTNAGLNLEELHDKYGISFDDMNAAGTNYYRINTTVKNFNEIKKIPAVDSAFEYLYPAGVTVNAQEECWPHAPQFRFNRDNFGPIVLPKKGDIVQLNMQTLPLYRRLISIYEHHALVVKDSSISIDGKVVSNYTIEGNYYWMMGDNRHNSLDSRFWGYVPETHVVGKAWFVWFSYQDKLWNPRFGRIFRGVKALEK
jgi:signal peptidase I